MQVPAGVTSSGPTSTSAAAAAAAAAPPKQPNEQGAQQQQQERLKRAVNAANALVWTKLHESGTPGMVVAVAVNGKVLMRHGEMQLQLRI